VASSGRRSTFPGPSASYAYDGPHISGWVYVVTQPVVALGGKYLTSLTAYSATYQGAPVTIATRTKTAVRLPGLPRGLYSWLAW
jgi:hypothetical protein